MFEQRSTVGKYYRKQEKWKQDILSDRNFKNSWGRDFSRWKLSILENSQNLLLHELIKPVHLSDLYYTFRQKVPKFNYALMKKIFPFVGFKPAEWLFYLEHLHPCIILSNKICCLVCNICNFLVLYYNSNPLISKEKLYSRTMSN